MDPDRNMRLEQSVDRDGIEWSGRIRKQAEEKRKQVQEVEENGIK